MLEKINNGETAAIVFKGVFEHMT